MSLDGVALKQQQFFSVHLCYTGNTHQVDEYICYIILHHTILYYIILYYIILYYIILYYIILCYAMLHYITLYYIILYIYHIIL